MKKIWSVTNLSSENSLLMFRLKSSRHQSEVWTNTTIYNHTLLRMCIIRGQRLVMIVPPSLPPHHSGPATEDFQFSISVEALLWGCHLDVQGLLHQQLLSSVVVQHCCLLPVDEVVVPPRMLCYSQLLHLKACIISNNSNNSVVAVRRVRKLQSIPQNGRCSYK